ncbi:hypothetical protein [Nocardia noduli]|uniref:hypothetical protein n=1 Tax=Nocardia noduli TaxID=2815722 RepID=UPI001C21C9C0|nr:hypothetical protein [Nocardia noduli]
MSSQLAADIDTANGTRAAGSGAVRAKLSAGMYVTRTKEQAIRAGMTGAGTVRRFVVVGEAGHGKTSLLWSLHRFLTSSTDRTPLLLSATWLLHGDRGTPVVTADDVLGFAEAEPDLVVLLDTADLLLHGGPAHVETLDLLYRLRELGIPTVVTTRPREAMAFDGDLGVEVVLDLYDDREFEAAVKNLVEFFDDAAEVPSDPTATIASAAARGLLVREVSRSPLLLRLVFELAAPSFPSLEIDVTGLYRRYWEYRVRGDNRGVVGDIDYRSDDDLGLDAGWIGVALLAMGSPEAQESHIVRYACEVAADAGHASVTPERITRAIQILTRRGVLIRGVENIRFLHQTFFEFAAAQGLIARTGKRESVTLMRRVLAHPDDLFVGAVLEQYLILLGDDRLSRVVVTECLDRLIESGHASLIEVAMLVWAHHPHAVPKTVSHDGSRVPVEALRRFVRVVPTVHDAEPRDVIDRLDYVWRQGNAVRWTVTESFELLARRAPDQVAAAARAGGYIDELIASHRDTLRSQSTVEDLLHSLTPVDPRFVCDCLIEIVRVLADGSKGKEAAARYLALAERDWGAIGSTEFLVRVEDLTRAMQQGSGDSDARLVRDTLGRVIAAHWRAELAGASESDRSRYWLDTVAAVCRELASDDQDVVHGAHLMSVAYIVRDMTRGDLLLRQTLSMLFALKDYKAPRQLARGAMTLLLAQPTAARDLLTVKFGELLSHLPARHNAPTSAPELWAAVARSCLIDAEIPSAVVAEAIRRSGLAARAKLWRHSHGLLGLLPAGAMGGITEARSQLDAVTADPGVLGDNTQLNVFLDRCVDRVPQEPELLLPPLIAVAAKAERLAVLTKTVRSAEIRAFILPRGPQLEALAFGLMRGSNAQQRKGAELLLAIVETRVVAVEFDRLATAFDTATAPAAKALVLRAIPLVVRDATATTAAALTLFRSIATVEDGILCAADCRRVNPIVLDAVRDAWLAVLGHIPDPAPSLWRTVHGLAFAPRPTGNRSVDITGFASMSMVLAHMTEAGSAEQAASALIEVCGALGDDRLRKGQKENAANRFRGGLNSVVKKCGRASLHRILDCVLITEATMGKMIVHAAIRHRYPDCEQKIDQLRATDIAGEVAQQIETDLRFRIRTRGFDSFEEILKPARGEG